MVTEPGTRPHAPSAGIPTGLVRLLAVAVAITVANLYYAQPLLDSLAAGFGVSEARSGW